MGKHVYLAMGAVLLAGMCSGAAGAWVYLSAAYNEVHIKYAESVSDYNKLSLKHSKSTVESIKKETMLTGEVLHFSEKLIQCNRKLMEVSKVECSSKKVKKKKKVYRKKKRSYKKKKK